jgi:hypothetical protein
LFLVASDLDLFFPFLQLLLLFPSPSLLLLHDAWTNHWGRTKEVAWHDMAWEMIIRISLAVANLKKQEAREFGKFPVFE